MEGCSNGDHSACVYQTGGCRLLRVHPLPGHPRRSAVPHGRHANGETEGTRDAKRDEVEERREAIK